MMQKSSPITPLWGYIVITVATIAVAAGGAAVAGGESDPWYVALEKPALNPPGYLFGIVWPILYVLMIVSACLVWRAGGRGRALSIFLAQLALNYGWTATFFGAHLIWPAMLVIVGVWLAIIAMIAAFHKHSPVAAWLQLPYLTWVSLASYLNGYIAIAN